MERDGDCSKFFCNHGNIGRCLNWMRWDRLTLDKKEDGLGFYDLFGFNLVLFAKQGCRLSTSDTSLCARVMKAKYFTNCHFMEAEPNEGKGSLKSGH